MKKKRSRTNTETRQMIGFAKFVIVALMILFFGSLIFGCSEEDPQAKDPGCEVASNMAAGPRWTIEVNTASQQPNLVLSVEHISTEHLVRVNHKEAITSLTLNSEAGDYKVGLVVCGSGTSGLPYSIKVVKPNGSIMNYSAKVGTMYSVNIQ